MSSVFIYLKQYSQKITCNLHPNIVSIKIKKVFLLVITYNDFTLRIFENEIIIINVLLSSRFGHYDNKQHFFIIKKVRNRC